MLELFTAFKAIEYYTNKDSIDDDTNFKTPISWIIVGLFISFCTAYIAYSCNQYEIPASRALFTLFGFFFSGFYLIYYFIYHILLDKKCSSRGINNIIKNITKK